MQTNAIKISRIVINFDRFSQYCLHATRTAALFITQRPKKIIMRRNTDFQSESRVPNNDFNHIGTNDKIVTHVKIQFHKRFRFGQCLVYNKNVLFALIHSSLEIDCKWNKSNRKTLSICILGFDKGAPKALVEGNGIK